MATIDAIDITSLLFQEGTAPSTPASTKWKVYFKTDGLYVIDDAGTETGPLGSGSSIAESAKMSKSSTQSVSNSTGTEVNFETEDWDDNGLIDLATDDSIITIQTAGKYHVVASMDWAGNSTGQRTIQVILNRTTTIGQADWKTPSTYQNGYGQISGIFSLSASDTLSVKVYQTSGGSLNLGGNATTSLAVARVA